MNEWRDEPSAGRVDVHGDIKAKFLIEVIEGHGHRLYRFILQRERRAQSRYHAECILVAALDHLLRRHHEPTAFAGNLTQFDIEVACEDRPAAVHKAAD